MTAWCKWNPPVRTGALAEPKIDESSGVAASRRNPGLYWTHNDGSGPFLYLFDKTGARRGTWRVRGATAYDWEDIAVGPGPERGTQYIYIGDIGDNDRKRKVLVVYRIPEPDASKPPGTTPAATVFRLRYPDGPHDAEGLAVHPSTGEIYIITKAKGSDRATGVYKIAPKPVRDVQTLTHVADLDLPGGSPFTLIVGRITGAAISPDGRRVVLCDYFRAYEAVLKGETFDRIWKGPWTEIDLGRRTQGEAICYRLDGKALIATSEGVSAPVIEVLRAR